MEKLVLTYRVRPEKKDEYIKAHDEFWPELTRGFKNAGVREMSVFIRGYHLFLYGLVDDLEVFNRYMKTDPDYQRWNEWMCQLLEAPYDDQEPSPFASLDEIWKFNP
jgi:L-rhamnose mutarotase